jgi:hypothetical protein
MLKMKKLHKKLTLLGFTLVAIWGITHVSAVDVFAAAESVPTIRIGDNSPMTRDEFMEWRNLRGFRHLNIDGRIYPAEIFFNWNNGQAFNYGELRDGTL